MCSNKIVGLPIVWIKWSCAYLWKNWGKKTTAIFSSDFVALLRENEQLQLTFYKRNTCSFTSCTGGGLKSFFRNDSVCGFSPRDLPVFCKWRDGLCLWRRLVVTRGDGVRSAAWMGKAWWEVRRFYVIVLQNWTSCEFPPSFSSSSFHFSSCPLVFTPEALWHPCQ